MSDLLVAGGSAAVGGGIGGKLKALDYSPHISLGPVPSHFGQAGAINIQYKPNPKWGDAAQKPVPKSAGSPVPYLSPAEFTALPQTGSISAHAVRFSQDSGAAHFKPPYGSVADFINDLKSGKVHPSAVKPIRIVVHNDRVYTLDNRRLHSFREAGIDVPYQKLDAVPVRERRKFSTKNGGTSIIIRKEESE